MHLRPRLVSTIPGLADGLLERPSNEPVVEIQTRVPKGSDDIRRRFDLACRLRTQDQTQRSDQSDAECSRARSGGPVVEHRDIARGDRGAEDGGLAGTEAPSRTSGRAATSGRFEHHPLDSAACAPTFGVPAKTSEMTAVGTTMVRSAVSSSSSRPIAPRAIKGDAFTIQVSATGCFASELFRRLLEWADAETREREDEVGP